MELVLGPGKGSSRTFIQSARQFYCAIGSARAFQPLCHPTCLLKNQRKPRKNQGLRVSTGMESRTWSSACPMELTANSAHAQPCTSHGRGISSATPPAIEAPDEETDLEGQVSCSSVQPPTPELT